MKTLRTHGALLLGRLLSVGSMAAMAQAKGAPIGTFNPGQGLDSAFRAVRAKF